jgi:hypothetical protein
VKCRRAFLCKMYSYSAYGLRIKSSLPIPEFVPAGTEEECGLVIQVESPARPVEVTDGHAGYLKVAPEYAEYAMKGVGAFRIYKGREVTLQPDPGVDDQLIRLYIVGAIMAIVLYQRGFLVLHGSAVRIGNGVAAFVGQQGAGKSSVAAALCAQGHHLVSDDVTSIDVSRHPFCVAPGYPQIKLDPKIASSLGFDSDRGILLHPSEEKRGWRVPHGFPSTALPLKGVFLLSLGEMLQIQPMRFQEAMVELVRHSLPTRWLHAGGEQHFSQCETLTKHVPFFRITRLDSVTHLPELAQSVVEHLI